MGQVALGLRSLVVRIIVFVVMAALLAWALGGTLWPRPVHAVQRPVVDAGGQQWGWRVTIDPTSQEVMYHLARREGSSWNLLEGGGPFASVEPLQSPPANLQGGVMLATACHGGGGRTQLLVTADGSIHVVAESMRSAEAE